MNATVKDVMTTNVVAVRKNASYKELAARLRTHHVSAFPVIDDLGKVIGVVSGADLLVKEAGLAARTGVLAGARHHHDRKKEAAVTAGALMTSPPVTIGPDATVEWAAEQMYARRVKRLPVVDPSGRLIGIVSRSDVLSVFRRPNEAIAREISEEVLLKRFLVDPRIIQVAVKDGIVTLTGRPETDAVGQRVAAEVRHVPGVVAVRDRLTYSGQNPAIPLPI